MPNHPDSFDFGTPAEHQSADYGRKPFDARLDGHWLFFATSIQFPAKPSSCLIQPQAVERALKFTKLDDSEGIQNQWHDDEGAMGRAVVWATSCMLAIAWEGHRGQILRRSLKQTQRFSSRGPITTGRHNNGEEESHYELCARMVEKSAGKFQRSIPELQTHQRHRQKSREISEDDRQRIGLLAGH